MRPSLFESSVSNEPLWPAGVAGWVLSPSAASAGERNQRDHGGGEQFVFMSLSPVVTGR